MSVGIDYSNGTANFDKGTGIHFGVLPQNDVLQAWADSSEPYYGDPSLDEEGNEYFDDFAEPISFFYEGGSYYAECGDDGDIFITKSPYFTYAAFCSPCAPGAGHLRSYTPDGVKTYCFGHDWFDDGVAPYPVFMVDTGEKIEP